MTYVERNLRHGPLIRRYRSSEPTYGALARFIYLQQSRTTKKWAEPTFLSGVTNCNSDGERRIQHTEGNSALSDLRVNNSKRFCLPCTVCLLAMSPSHIATSLEKNGPLATKFSIRYQGVPSNRIPPKCHSTLDASNIQFVLTFQMSFLLKTSHQLITWKAASRQKFFIPIKSKKYEIWQQKLYLMGSKVPRLPHQNSGWVEGPQGS